GIILPNAQAAGETFWSELSKRDVIKSWGVKNDFRLARMESPLPTFPLSPFPGADWLYAETITPPCALWIAGSGHIAQAVAPLALQLDFTVSIFDDRPELANHDIFPRDV